MKVSRKTTKNLLPKIKANAKKLSDTSVEVGAFDGEHSWLAGIHEYGCNIKVTDKMRAYLNAHGLHLKKSTTTIHIPERSFLRAGHDANIDSVVKTAAALLPDVLTGAIDERTLLREIGLTLSGKIKEHARDIKKPANHSFTVERKGSSNPLVDTGEMIGSITWRIGDS